MKTASTPTFETLMRDLTIALETENARLVSGDLSDMQNIIDSKLDILRQLQPWLGGNRDLPKPSESSTELKHNIYRAEKLSVRNGAILRALINGVKSARARISNLKILESSVGAYDRMGRGIYIDGGSIKNTKTM